MYYRRHVWRRKAVLSTQGIKGSRGCVVVVGCDRLMLVGEVKQGR